MKVTGATGATTQAEVRLHCTSCGKPFEQAGTQGWPRTCAGCGKITYKNPIPVAVVLLPVLDRKGLLVIRRAVKNDPGWGQFALPGGFIDINDASWQAAAAREVREEVAGVSLDPAGFRLFDVISAPDRTLLLFVLAAGVNSSDLPAFKPSDEASEMAVITAPQELAFPLHTHVVRRYFEQAGR